MDENEKPTGESAGNGQPSETHRRQRGKNIALALVLFAMAVLFYVVAIVKMSGN